ncbi:MAG: hypothetical protein CMJ81_06570 [Planctomycetaceae bacterium]|nr:hypothetical protein [Planctomycetaceae bacterium]MBP63106.1 hypothetical protein [Planctomycetaceae bacterium]
MLKKRVGIAKGSHSLFLLKIAVHCYCLVLFCRVELESQSFSIQPGDTFITRGSEGEGVLSPTL